MAQKKEPKKSFWQDEKKLATLAALLDVLLRKLAQRLAANVPQDSPLRSEAVETAIAVLKALLEFAGGLNPLVKVGGEKITDFIDFFFGALGATKGERVPKISGWFEAFFKEASERIAKAEDPQLEMERLKLEFQFRTELLKLYQEWEETQKPQPAAVPPAPAFNWEKFLAGAKTRWEGIVRSADEKFGRSADRIEVVRKGIEGINRKMPFRIF
jgi:hypothetical protein